MSKGLVHLLEFWFTKGKVAMDDYMKQMDDLERKAVDDEEKRVAKAARNEEIARIKAKYYHDPPTQTSGDDFEGQSDISGNNTSPRR
jgi:hypothetical protein